jgi:hypothetical protein
MQSFDPIDPDFISFITSIDIGQAFEHFLHEMQFSGFDWTLNLRIPNVSPTIIPPTMNGDIQQIEWHAPRLPIKTVHKNNSNNTI